MKVHSTSDVEIRNLIIKGLRENDGFCPCIINSKGKEEYRCMCEDFRNNTPVGKTCHCGLYIKDEQ